MIFYATNSSIAIGTTSKKQGMVVSFKTKDYDKAIMFLSISELQSLCMNDNKYSFFHKLENEEKLLNITINPDNTYFINFSIVRNKKVEYKFSMKLLKRDFILIQKYAEAIIDVTINNEILSIKKSKEAYENNNKEKRTYTEENDTYGYSI